MIRRQTSPVSPPSLSARAGLDGDRFGGDALHLARRPSLQTIAEYARTPEIWTEWDAFTGHLTPLSPDDRLFVLTLAQENRLRRRRIFWHACRKPALHAAIAAGVAVTSLILIAATGLINVFLTMTFQTFSLRSVIEIFIALCGLIMGVGVLYFWGAVFILLFQCLKTVLFWLLARTRGLSGVFGGDTSTFFVREATQAMDDLRKVAGSDPDSRAPTLWQTTERIRAATILSCHPEDAFDAVEQARLDAFVADLAPALSRLGPADLAADPTLWPALLTLLNYRSRRGGRIPETLVAAALLILAADDSPDARRARARLRRVPDERVRAALSEANRA